MNALVNPSVRQIVAQVDVVLRHDPAANAIGIRAMGRGDWPPQVRVGERDFSVVWCPSPISIREQLVALGSAVPAASSPPGLVVMTPLADQALGADVLGRLSRGKVFPVEAWDMVRHSFQARDIDSRLARWPWVAEALLENLPASGYPPARGGLLDVDTAWSHVLRSVLGLSTDHGGRPDLAAVLRWSLSPEASLRYSGLPGKARKQIEQWFAEVLGSCGRLIGQVLEAGYGGELMPLALVCGMVLKPEAPAAQELLAASVRLERFTGGVPVSMRDGQRLHAAAVQVAAGMDASGLMPVLDVADRLVESLHLLSHAHVSDDLPSGFSARLDLFAESVGAFLKAENDKDQDKRFAAVANVQSAGRDAMTHRLAVHHGYRVGRVEMAMRLVQWLAQTDAPPGQSLGDIVRRYADDGAFVDWARLALLGGDELAGVSRAYGALREMARERREKQNRQFAHVLAGWNAGGCLPVADVIPVERIVSDILAPVAASVPVLLLVVDGLSFPIFRELIEDAQRQGWNEVLPSGKESSPLGLATIPSVTEISRTSLFCGALTQGQSANEKSGFAQHPALLPLVPSNRANARPVLFHKGDLTSGGDGTSLSEVVRDAIASRERKVVGVVFNGVDDHLSGSDQLNQRWTLDDLRLIKPLLYEARNAGRLVLMTSDHGHVIDESTHAMAAAEKANAKSGDCVGGDRWRNLAGAVSSSEEIAFSGGRVKTPDGRQQVIVPWSETLRYGLRKNGYHGGVSLQEMVVPVALLATGGALPEGFHHAPCKVPEWWDIVVQAQVEKAPEPLSAPVLAGNATAKKAKSGGAADLRQQALFELPTTVPTDSTSRSPELDWIANLLSSPVFQAQKQWAARAAIKDDEIRRLLEALSERGGRLSKAALAARLAMPLMRVSGFVNAARRLLNVDQSPILTLDETEGAVTLSRSLLEVQFQLAKGVGQ